MGFFRINGQDSPEIKRPFRLSDLQDVWNGITSLFKPVVNQSFRIISGFDVTDGTYSGGAVFYNGQIYEYDESKPITTNSASVFFAKIAQDDRQLASGIVIPFSYRYVCGGSSFASDDGYVSQDSFSSFVANIEKYKTYIGDGTVVTSKLADSSVTTAKLATGSVTGAKVGVNAIGIGNLATVAQVLPNLNRSDNVSIDGDQTVLISSLIRSSLGFTSQIDINSGNLAILCRGNTSSSPALLPIVVHNKRSSSATLTLYGAAEETIDTLTLPANTGLLLLFASVATTLNGSNVVYYPIATKTL